MEKDKCKNCESPLHGKFCSACGQQAFTEKDKSIKYLFQEAFQFMTSIDGKLIKTLITVYKSPGKLSHDFSDGIRQKYYKPISFYLFIVLLYLLFPLMSGMNMEMKYYKATPVFGKIISRQIDDKLITENISEESLAEKFQQKSNNTSKFLMLLLIPFSVPILYLLGFKKRPYVFDHYILATEINIFFLLTFFILIPVLVFPLTFFHYVTLNEMVFTLSLVILFTIYCVILFHRYFKEKWWTSIGKGTVFGLTFMGMIVVLYRTIVFEITFFLL